MVVVFFTFALSRPVAPKEMGVILGVAVLLDTLLDPSAGAPEPSSCWPARLVDTAPSNSAAQTLRLGQGEVPNLRVADPVPEGEKA